MIEIEPAGYTGARQTWVGLVRRLAPPVLVFLVATSGISGSIGVRAPKEAPAVPVSKSLRLASDGARLYVELRGANRQAPVLVWLHGGPGAPERPLFRYFNRELERYFTVVYWDQRGAGRSFEATADPAELTVERHRRDLHSVVQYAQQEFGQSRVVLVGHSWGATLGLLYASEHPERVAALVAVAPDVAHRESQRLQVDFVAREAARRADRDALRVLARLGPPPYTNVRADLAVERLADRYGASYHRRPRTLWVLFRGLAGRLVGPLELPRFFRANFLSLQAMQDEILALDLRATVPRLETPVVFMLGRHDRHVEATLAAAYFEALVAPRKQLVWFENSAHNPPFEEAARFNTAVIALLETLATDTALR